MKHALYLAFVLGLWILASNEDYKAAKASEAMTRAQFERLALERTRALTSCMNGDARIIWRDPHTDEDMVVFCDRHSIGRVK